METSKKLTLWEATNSLGIGLLFKFMVIAGAGVDTIIFLVSIMLASLLTKLTIGPMLLVAFSSVGLAIQMSTLLSIPIVMAFLAFPYIYWRMYWEGMTMLTYSKMYPTLPTPPRSKKVSDEVIP